MAVHAPELALIGRLVGGPSNGQLCDLLREVEYVALMDSKPVRYPWETSPDAALGLLREAHSAGAEWCMYEAVEPVVPLMPCWVYVAR